MPTQRDEEGWEPLRTAIEEAYQGLTDAGLVTDRNQQRVNESVARQQENMTQRAAVPPGVVVRGGFWEMDRSTMLAMQRLTAEEFRTTYGRPENWTREPNRDCYIRRAPNDYRGASVSETQYEPIPITYTGAPPRYEATYASYVGRTPAWRWLDEEGIFKPTKKQSKLGKPTMILYRLITADGNKSEIKAMDVAPADITTAVKHRIAAGGSVLEGDVTTKENYRHYKPVTRTVVELIEYEEDV